MGLPGPMGLRGEGGRAGEAGKPGPTVRLCVLVRGGDGDGFSFYFLLLVILAEISVLSFVQDLALWL